MPTKREAALLAQGQTLGDLRQTELCCACHVLHADPINNWRYPDGGLRDRPLGSLTERVCEVLREIFDE